MPELERERDLVLNPNEYAYVLDKTKGLISCVVGSFKMSLSTSDSLVRFNERNKKFEETSFQDAIMTFVSAPENWYIILKNPAQDDKHPTPGTSNQLPSLQIGKKVNIRGNTSFALYPGQMAKVIKGHTLHSNQYLLARVYDADVLDKVPVLDEEGNPTEEMTNKYTVGQLLVIKGTETQFYIPPTGIEVIPVGGSGDQYVRDAVTLEKLEYCILKDEQGNKKYIHGAAVVFPQPDEVFAKNPKGGYKFRAIELTDISGVYVKVISDYKENGKEYKAGDELFITGKDQTIYYPRPEHAIIDYDGKVVHHAIAIPVGEGRYVLDRKTGNIKTIKGAAMYLPDPRNEVIVKRKLTAKQCELWFPGNKEVLKYNTGISEEANTYSSSVVRKAAIAEYYDEDDYEYTEDAVVEDGGFSRGTTYSKPRTIVIDNKYDGVVSIDVWTGYAINVVSKNGTRKVITGAQTYLMAYDETLEVLELSTGRPKTTDNLLKTVYLRVENNKISDLINVQTKDFVDVQVKVSYCVDFLPEYQDKWFSVENYVKYLTDRQRSLIKREAKLHTIEDFYENASDIVRKVALNISDTKEETKEEGKRTGRLFKENGMLVHDVEVLSVFVEDEIDDIMNEHQHRMIEKSLELSTASKEIDVVTRLAEVDKLKADLDYQNKIYRIELESKLQKERLEKNEELKRKEEAAELAAKTAELKLQTLKDSIQKSELARKKERTAAEVAAKKEMDNLDITKQKAYTDALKKVIDAISPELIASMTSSANAELLKSVSEAMSPYAMATGQSVAEVTNMLLRGTSLEGLIDKIGTDKKERRDTIISDED